MSRLLESRGFWFKLACVVCLAFGILVQILAHVRDEPTSIKRPHPQPAHAPGGGPIPLEQE